MILTITDWAGDRVSLEPKVELYSVRDFMGKELPGLAIVLDKVGGTPDEAEEYAVLTVSFGDFLSLKNGAYIDTNNCYFADQLLRQGIAEDTGFSRHSGFCQYPLWRFKEEFLKGIGGENYQEYLRRYDDFLDSMLGFPSGRSSFYEAEAGAASAFLRDYAGTGCREYFADYFAYYIANRGNAEKAAQMERLTPETFAFFSALEAGSSKPDHKTDDGGKPHGKGGTNGEYGAGAAGRAPVFSCRQEQAHTPEGAPAGAGGAVRNLCPGGNSGLPGRPVPAGQTPGPAAGTIQGHTDSEGGSDRWKPLN